MFFRALLGLSLAATVCGCGLLLDADLPTPDGRTQTADSGATDLGLDATTLDALDSTDLPDAALADGEDGIDASPDATDASPDAIDADLRDGASDAGDSDASEADVVVRVDGGEACRPPVRLVAPMSGSIVASNRPVLEWNDACSTAYLLRVARRRNLDLPVAEYFDRSVTGRRVELEALGPGVYFWQVRRVGDPAGVASPVSEFRVLAHASARSEVRRSALGLMPDVDGDGISDLVVGLTGAGAGPGRVRWMLGARVGRLTTVREVAGNALFTDPELARGFGARVSPIGDANNDGFPDVLVATSNVPGGSAAVVLFGSFDGLSADRSARVDLPRVQSSLAGTLPAVVGVGDTDRDGFGDLAVGTEDNRVLVFGTAPSRPRAELVAPTADIAFGRALAPVGDANADGFADFVIGAPRTGSTPGISSLRALVTGTDLLAHLSLTVVPLSSPAPDATATNWVAGAGDQNDDGRGDWLWSRNVQLVVEGQPGGFASWWNVLTASPLGIYLAAAVGDHDHDGRFEILGFINRSAGPAQLFSWDGTHPVASIEAPGLGDDLKQVGTAGDLDGDDEDDPIVVTQPAGGPATMHVYTYLSGALAHTTAVSTAGTPATVNFATAY